MHRRDSYNRTVSRVGTLTPLNVADENSSTLGFDRSPIFVLIVRTFSSHRGDIYKFS